MKKKHARVLPTVLVLGVIAAGALGFWYAKNKGWFEDRGPNNLPTAEERARMEEIDRTSSMVAPDALPGVGVVPKGSTPPPAPVVPSASSTSVLEPEASTTEASTLEGELSTEPEE
ncbi:MAG: hypothetical protein KBD21_00295 [Candidatus Pacebacteria bacterium]|nr:hypothetical protein [Candidatus Paceibacterota bacterium]